MLALKNTASWTSVTYQQEAGDTDWGAYQLVMTASPYAYSINSAATTSTSLSLYDNSGLTSGQTLVLSTDGSTFTTGVAGVITTTVPTAPTPTRNAANSQSSATVLGSTGTTYAAPYFLKQDGTKLWRVVGTTLTEYVLSTPFDFTTATASGRAVSGFGNNGFCFTQYGNMLLACDGTNVIVRGLATPWDITTAGSASSFPLPSGLAGTIRQMRISFDGKTFVVMNGGSAGNTTTSILYTYSLPVANVFSTISLVNTSSTFSTATTGYATFAFSRDGKTLVVLASDGGTGTTVLTVRTYNCPTPWSASGITQYGSTFTLTSADFNGLTSTSPIGLVMNPNGTSFTVFIAGGFATYTADLNTKYAVNITSFGLSAPPTSAYAAIPRIFADMEPTSARVNTTPLEQDFISATTTQAVFGANGTGLVGTGDVLTLSTGNVTVTSVTQGATAGLSAQAMGLTSNYITYSGKVSPDVGFAPFMLRMRPNGQAAFLITTTGYIYQYTLLTPWDVSTMVLSNVARVGTTYISSFSTLRGIDFNPNGTSMYLQVILGSGTNTVYEFSLPDAWNISTAVATGKSASFLSSSYVNTGGRFNETGTIYYCQSLSGSTYYLPYFAMTVPYDLSTATAAVLGVSSGGSAVYGNIPPVMSPGGVYLVTGSQAGSLGEQTLTQNGTLAGGWTNQSTISTGNVTLANIPTRTLLAHDFSPDGMRLFVAATVSGANNIYAYRVRTKPLTQYTAGYAAQASATTSVTFPDRAVERAVTPSLVGGALTFSSSQVLATGRALAVKTLAPNNGMNVSAITINLWKT